MVVLSSADHFNGGEKSRELRKYQAPKEYNDGSHLIRVHTFHFRSHLRHFRLNPRRRKQDFD
jgi:hypothetical protein